MTRTTNLTVALYALFILSWAVEVVLPSSCPAPLPGGSRHLPAMVGALPFVLGAVFCIQAARRRRYALQPGWCSQTLVWPLLTMGIAGAALGVSCGSFEAWQPTQDVFVTAMHGSVWALRSKLGLLAGLTGVALFHWSARPARTAPSAL